MILQILRTLSRKFGVTPLLGSGAIAFQSQSPKRAMIGQVCVLSDSVLCFFSEVTADEILAVLESSTILLLHANFRSRSCLKH